MTSLLLKVFRNCDIKIWRESVYVATNWISFHRNSKHSHYRNRCELIIKIEYWAIFKQIIIVFKLLSSQAFLLEVRHCNDRYLVVGMWEYLSMGLILEESVSTIANSWLWFPDPENNTSKNVFVSIIHYILTEITSPIMVTSNSGDSPSMDMSWDSKSPG